ncbi:MAG TPA: beta-ketoacyl-[acyl-carrier-protein] synthase family protein [Thermomicrobiales bacterium]
MTRAVAITGIGAITPIGNGPDGLWAGVRLGESAVRRIDRFDPSPFSSQVAADCEFDPLCFMDERKARRLDRFAQLSLACAKMAIADSGLSPQEAQAAGMGVYTGSALGGVAFGEEQHERYIQRGARAVSPMLALSVFGGASACVVAIELGLTGPTIANANSCASGLIAIGEAARLIASGRATAMLAGGIEAPLAPLTFGAFALIRVLSTRNDDPATASRPFDVDRDGFVMAEGGAMLVLEDAEHARARGARPYAIVSGYGTTNDAHHMTAPRPDGTEAARAMCLALHDAEVPAEAIEYVNAHGSSTVLNDSTECLAIRHALGRHAERVAVSGTKGLHGHALGATCAIETAICALSFTHDHLPGTANLQRLDPACDLDIIPPGGRDAAVEYMLTNAFGFGGINASLVLRRAS